jgi:hypothetical protein
LAQSFPAPEHIKPNAFALVNDQLAVRDGDQLHIVTDVSNLAARRIRGCKRRSKSAAGGGPIVRHLAQLTAVTLRGQAATEECGRLGQWRSFPAGTSGPTKRSAAPSIFVGGPAAATDFEPPVRVAAGRDA